MDTKLILVAILCVASVATQRDIEVAPKGGLNYRDPRNYYNPDDDYDEPEISLPAILELIRRGGGQGRPGPGQHFNQQPYNHQPQEHHVHHHIHYTPSNFIKIMQMLAQGGRPGNPTLYNFADAEEKEPKQTEESSLTEEVVFGDDNCPKGYKRVSEKCVKSN